MWYVVDGISDFPQMGGSIFGVLKAGIPLFCVRIGYPDMLKLPSVHSRMDRDESDTRFCSSDKAYTFAKEKFSCLGRRSKFQASGVRVLM